MKISLQRSATLLLAASALSLAQPKLPAVAAPSSNTAAGASSAAPERPSVEHRRHARTHHTARAHQQHGRRLARKERLYAAAQLRARKSGRRAETQPATVIGFGGSDVVAEARRYIGGNPTGRSSLWCARFMNLVLERTGHGGSGSNLARSFASYGRRVSGPQVGAIAVIGRRGGGHVGVVSGIDAAGNPIIISGNHGRRVAEARYARGRVFAYVMPPGA